MKRLFTTAGIVVVIESSFIVITDKTTLPENCSVKSIYFSVLPTPACIYLDVFVDEPIIMYVDDVCGLDLTWTFDFLSEVWANILHSAKTKWRTFHYLLILQNTHSGNSISRTTDTSKFVQMSSLKFYGGVITLPAVLLRWGLNFSIQQHGSFSIKGNRSKNNVATGTWEKLKKFAVPIVSVWIIEFCLFHFQGLPTPLEQFFFRWTTWFSYKHVQLLNRDVDRLR